MKEVNAFTQAGVVLAVGEQGADVLKQKEGALDLGEEEAEHPKQAGIAMTLIVKEVDADPAANDMDDVRCHIPMSFKSKEPYNLRLIKEYHVYVHTPCRINSPAETGEDALRPSREVATWSVRASKCRGGGV